MGGVPGFFYFYPTIQQNNILPQSKFRNNYVKNIYANIQIGFGLACCFVGLLDNSLQHSTLKNLTGRIDCGRSAILKI